MSNVPTLVPESEYSITAMRSSGPGGQHVNKVSTAVLLRFDIKASSLPETTKQRLLELKDKRITLDGVVVLKSNAFRSQQKNKESVIAKLHALIQQASHVPKKRKPTKPTKESVEKRKAEKARKAELKSMRKKPDTDR
jgi:ribosome-associated protein